MFVQANRDAALEALDEIAQSPPFDANIRFPNKAIHVDLDHSMSYVARHLRSMVTALLYQDRQKRIESRHPESLPAMDTKLLQNENDACSLSQIRLVRVMVVTLSKTKISLAFILFRGCDRTCLDRSIKHSDQKSIAHLLNLRLGN